MLLSSTFPNPTILSWHAVGCAVTHSMTISVVCITKNGLISLNNFFCGRYSLLLLGRVFYS